MLVSFFLFQTLYAIPSLYLVKKTAMFPRFQLPEIKFTEAKSWKEKSPWNQMTLVVQSSALLYWPFY